MKRLMVRSDRIGDLILTFPVSQHLPIAQETWVVSKSNEFLLNELDTVLNYKVLPPSINPNQFFNFYKWLKNEGFDECHFFNGPWWLAALVFLVRIPVRRGRLSQWYSFLFFNYGIRQKRSLSNKHEFEYNLELSGVLSNKESLLNIQKVILQKRNFDFSKFGLSKGKFLIVHAGMKGSARNWSPKNYIKLIEKLSLDTKVVLTGTKEDLPYLKEVVQSIQNLPNVISMIEKVHPNEILSFISGSKYVVSPSTGMAHMATLVGVPLVAIYSPLKVESAKRWGPLGKKVRVLSPSVNCPESMKCKFEKCEYFDCMDRIEVQDIYKGIRNDLNGAHDAEVIKSYQRI